MKNYNIYEDKFEISIKELFSFVKKYYKRAILIAIIGGVFGLVYSFTKIREYTAQTILLPEYRLAAGSSFMSLAFGAGNLNFDGAEKLGPELYPNILSSTPFALSLLDMPLKDKDNNSYDNFKNYLGKDSTVSFIGSVLKFILPKNDNDIIKFEQLLYNELEKNNIIFLDAKKNAQVSYVTNIVNTEIDAKNGIITIRCEFEDQVIAAQIVEFSKKYIIQYIENYRTSKIASQKEFLVQRVKEVEKKLKESEYGLQSYRDKNRDSYLNTFKIKELQLQNDFNLYSMIFNDLSNRLEQTIIKEKEEKPVFKVLEPTRVPIFKSSPNRKVYFLAGSFLAVIIFILYIVFYKEKYHLRIFN